MSWLITTWPVLTSAITVGLLIVLTLLLWWLRRARQPNPDRHLPEARAGYVYDATSSAVPKSSAPSRLFRGLRKTEPRFLAIGSTRPGEVSVLGRSLQLPRGRPEQIDRGDQPRFNWWRFERAAIAELVSEDLPRRVAHAREFLVWRRLLDEIQALRPRRPCDGLLVVVSARDFSGAGRSAQQCAAEAAALGHAHGLMVEEALTRFRMNLPLHVLVTDGEHIAGFRTLADSVSEADLNRGLGWVSPYSSGTPYHPGWIDQVFDGTHSQIERHELAAAISNSARLEGIMRLSPGLETLREPLRAYCNQLFGGGSRQGLGYGAGRAALRSVNFCGDDPVIPGPPSSAPQRSWEQAAFVADPLERELFPSAAIAHPTPQAVIKARTRGIGAFAVLTLIAFGWALAQWFLAKPALDTEATALATFLKELRQVDASADPASARAFLKRAQSIPSLDLPDAILRFSIPDVDLSRGIEARLGKQFDRRVVSPLGEILDDALFDPARKGVETPAPAAGTLPVSESPFARLERTVELFEAVGAFQILTDAGTPGTEKLAALDTAARFALKAGFEPGRRARHILAGTLRRTTVPALPNARQRVQAQWAREVERYVNTFSPDSELRARISAAAIALASLGQAEPKLDEYVNLRRQLDALHDRLRKFRLPLRDKSPTLPERDKKLAERVKALPLLGPTASDAFETKLDARLRQAELEPLEVNVAPYLGHLVVENEGNLQLSNDAQWLREALQFLLELPFMRPAAGGNLRTDLSASEQFVWRAGPLAQAYEEFQAFERSSVTVEDFLARKRKTKLPSPLHTTFPTLARIAATARVRSHVVKAQKPIRTSDYTFGLLGETQAVVADLAALASPLAQATAALNQLRANRDAAAVIKAVQAQAERVFSNLDRLLAERSAYLPKQGNFSWWNGDDPPADPGFVTEATGDVAGYLKRMRAGIQELAAGVAVPLLRAMSTIGARERSAAASRWRNIISELEAYGAARPSELADLEAYISGQLTKINLSTCFEDTSGGKPPSSSRFFLARQANLRQLLGEQCKNLADQQGYQLYATLSEQFRNTLSRRFPFTQGNEIGIADVEQIKAFFAPEFETLTLLVEHLPQLTSDEVSPRFCFATEDDQRQARRFVSSMNHVRRFFANFVSPEAENDAPAYPVAARFRALRSTPGAERGADQIYNWTLGFGNARLDLVSTNSVSYPDGVKGMIAQADWAYGMPVQLTVEWSSDSPRSPYLSGGPELVTVNDAPVKRVRVDNKHLEISYPGPWSLIRLLKDYASNEGPAKGAPPTMLGFNVVTVANPPPEGSETQLDPTRFFIRVGLLAEKKSTQVLAFPAFPAHAPVIGPPLGFGTRAARNYRRRCARDGSASRTAEAK